MASNCKELKLLNWNANGIKRQENELRYFIKSNKIMIAGITETHLVEGDKFSIPGFRIYRNDRLAQKAAGGVAIIVSKSIKHSQVSTPISTNLESVGIKIIINNSEITLIAAYKPPNKIFPTSCYKEIFDKYSRIILLGDLNSKHRSWGCNSSTAQGKRLFKFTVENNISVLTPTEATHFPYNTNIVPDILDVVLTKGITFPIFQNVLYDLQSDHNPVLIKLFKPIEENTNSMNGKGLKINWPQFSFFMQQNYSYPHNIQFNQDIDYEINKFILAVNESLKQATIINRNTFKNTGDTIPARLLNLIKSKRNLRRFWQKTRRPDIKRKLNKLSRIVKFRLEQFRFSSFENSLKQINTNATHLWSTVKRITGEKMEIPPLKCNNEKAYSDLEKAEILADQLERTFRPHPITEHNHNQMVEDFMSKPEYLAPSKIEFISPSEVMKVIKRLKPRKAPGYDKISNKIIKQLNKYTIAAITAIFNGILRLNYFPEAWKVAIILPFRKPGKDPRLAINYRPISLLPTLSKIFEKLLLNRLNKFLTISKAIPDEQFGFRSNHSCTHQLLRLTENIADGFQKKKHTVAIFLDIAQAYDRVWHTGLMYKLRILGVPDYIQKLIYGFLQDRSFFVKVNDTLSTQRKITAGVPQGSALSPTLFNIYISDIPKMTYSKLALFADDTALFSSHENVIIARNRIQNNIKQIVTWTNQWRIKLNPTKCQAKIFTLRRPKIPPNIKIHNNPIIWNNGPVKYLGVLFDKRLTWKPHVLATVNKTYGKIMKLYPFINRKSSLKIQYQLLLFKAVILPSLTYACPVWVNTAATTIEKLQVVQNKCLRRILQAPWFVPNAQIHRELGVDSIENHILKRSQNFFSSLNSSHLTHKFNLGRNVVIPSRIKSKFPKDKLRPP